MNCVQQEDFTFFYVDTSRMVNIIHLLLAVVLVSYIILFIQLSYTVIAIWIFIIHNLINMTTLFFLNIVAVSFNPFTVAQ